MATGSLFPTPMLLTRHGSIYIASHDIQSSMSQRKSGYTVLGGHNTSRQQTIIARPFHESFSPRNFGNAFKCYRNKVYTCGKYRFGSVVLGEITNESFKLQWEEERVMWAWVAGVGEGRMWRRQINGLPVSAVERLGGSTIVFFSLDFGCFLVKFTSYMFTVKG